MNFHQVVWTSNSKAIGLSPILCPYELRLPIPPPFYDSFYGRLSASSRHGLMSYARLIMQGTRYYLRVNKPLHNCCMYLLSLLSYFERRLTPKSQPTEVSLLMASNEAGITDSHCIYGYSPVSSISTPSSMERVICLVSVLLPTPYHQG